MAWAEKSLINATEFKLPAATYFGGFTASIDAVLNFNAIALAHPATTLDAQAHHLEKPTVAVAVAVAAFKLNVHAADMQVQTEIRAPAMKTADKPAERRSPNRATDVRRLGFGVKASSANVSTTTRSSAQASNAVVQLTKRESTLLVVKTGTGTDERESF